MKIALLALALLVAFGRLSADREFVALQACGVSLTRLLRPVAACATNTGTASGSGQALDTYDPRVTISGLPVGCSNNTTTHVVTCNTAGLRILRREPSEILHKPSAELFQDVVFVGQGAGAGCAAPGGPERFRRGRWQVPFRQTPPPPARTRWLS